MAEIRGILFDLGDTLLDFGPVDTIGLFEQGARLTYERLGELGVSLPSFSTYHRRQLWAVRWAYIKSHITRREFDSLYVLCRLAKSMGHSLPADELAELAWLWYRPLSRQATVEPHVPETLQAFAEGETVLGVVSNTFIPASVLDRHLSELGLLKWLPIRVYSCEARFRKPHPKIFAQALAKTGLAASQVAFVGDSPKADVYGAARAGMVTVLKDPTGRRKPYRIAPRYRIASLAELPGIIAQHR